MWLTDTCIILPADVIERGALRIEDGRIVAVIEGDAPPERGVRVIDAHGLTVLPGLIDIHGDMVEKEIEPRPDTLFPVDVAVHELDKRLAASGVTTAYAALSFYDVDRPAHARSREKVYETVTALHRLRPELLVDHAVHARYEVSTPTSADLVHQLLNEGKIQLVSLMDHTPGQGQYRDIERFIDWVANHRQADRAAVEREMRERMQRGLAAAARNWEVARELAEAASEKGVPLASHDDDTIEKVDLVARLGATIAEFPVTIEAAGEARQRGMHVVMGAPNVMRGGSHSGNLSAQEAIAAGLVDTLASDYSPAALIQAVFALVQRGILDLPAAVRLVTLNPADALGMPDRGRIQAGCYADLTLIENGALPRVRGVLRHGAPIYWDRNMAGRGQLQCHCGLQMR
ncbi:MAG: phosphonate metabolism protein PhnM [Chloroflexi bacterium]|nr:phosphonate metabolism protein PhnM [Chloroflexota bacterium]